VLVKWYDSTKWVLGHVDNFPKNQRFVFGQRLADGVLEILELIVDATYSDKKSKILLEVNRRLEVLRWLLCLAFDRRLLAGKQAPGSKCRKSRFISVRRFEFFQPIAVLDAARYCGAATTYSLLSPKTREPRNTPNTRKDDLTLGGVVSVCSVCSVVKKNAIATQTQDHLPDWVCLIPV
jgi:hypothetical protein